MGWDDARGREDVLVADDVVLLGGRGVYDGEIGKLFGSEGISFKCRVDQNYEIQEGRERWNKATWN